MLQKSLFNESTPDTPASPPPMIMDDSGGVPLLNTDPDPEPEHISEVGVLGDHTVNRSPLF